MLIEQPEDIIVRAQNEKRDDERAVAISEGKRRFVQASSRTKTAIIFDPSSQEYRLRICRTLEEGGNAKTKENAGSAKIPPEAGR